MCICGHTLEEFATGCEALLNVLASLHVGLDHFNNLFLLLFVAVRGCRI